MEQFGEKQHEATPFRRQQAREQGQVARSQDLVSAAMLLGALGILYYYGGGVVKFHVELARRQLAHDRLLGVDQEFLVDQWQSLTGQLALLLLPVFGLMVLLALIMHLAQVGFLFLPQKLAFDASRVNPLKGIQRIFSLTNGMRLLLGIFKIGVVGIVACWSLWSDRDTILALSTLTSLEVGSFLVDTILLTCSKVGVALFVLALLDYAYQRWKHEQDLRMSTQEMREEMKTLQGDPQIAARRRAVQRQLVLNRIGTAVPKSDVVVTNPTELAIAIQYDHETMDAPVVLAKGAGLLAQRIRRLALEHSVPIVERKDLAQALYKQVEISKPIPREQYAAMAEVLRYVYQLKGRTI
jgi:flagellar biosynthetic protein FlhB